ncbi:MAG: hypothetical protein NVS4B3_07040 [Gemmatimonadaceae bacterium]
MREKQSTIANVLDGAIAGALATWLMGTVTTVLYERESETTRHREDAARAGKTAYSVAAEKVAGVAGVDLTKAECERYGEAIHWTLGIGAGVLYGLLRARSERASVGGGLLFGAAFWLLVDEALTPAIGLTRGPRAFPWQTHTRGFVGHLVFGTVANAALAVVQDTGHFDRDQDRLLGVS